MSSEKITIAVAILGLVGTLGGIFITHHFSRAAEFERRQTQQAIEAYCVVLDNLVGKNDFVPLVPYADPDVLNTVANLEKTVRRLGGDLKNNETKSVTMATFRAMRTHLTGATPDAVNDGTMKDIEILLSSP